MILQRPVLACHCPRDVSSWLRALTRWHHCRDDASYLRRIGIIDRFLRDSHLPCYGSVLAWGTKEPAITDLVFDPNGRGWPLDRARVDASLRDMAHTAGAELVPAARLALSARDGNGWYVTLTAGGRSS